MPHVMLTSELVDYLEQRNGALVEGKARMGEHWEVPLDSDTHNMLFKNRQPSESWSEVVMRLVLETDRLADVGGKVKQ